MVPRLTRKALSKCTVRAVYLHLFSCELRCHQYVCVHWPMSCSQSAAWWVYPRWGSNGPLRWSSLLVPFPFVASWHSTAWREAHQHTPENTEEVVERGEREVEVQDQRRRHEDRSLRKEKTDCQNLTLPTKKKKSTTAKRSQICWGTLTQHNYISNLL